MVYTCCGALSAFARDDPAYAHWAAAAALPDLVRHADRPAPFHRRTLTVRPAPFHRRTLPVPRQGVCVWGGGGGACARACLLGTPHPLCGEGIDPRAAGCDFARFRAVYRDFAKERTRMKSL